MRLARDWTQEDVAERSGVEPRNLHDIEHAKVNTSALTLFRLLEAFDVTGEQLLVRPRSRPRAADTRSVEGPPSGLEVRAELQSAGRRIAFYRKAARLSVGQLAKRAKMAMTTLYALEHADRPVALEHYLRAGAALNLSMAAIFLLDPKDVVASQTALPAPVQPRARKKEAKKAR